MTERKPTADEIAGMAWWNGMTEAQRATAMQIAKATTAAQAWDYQKLMMQIEEEAEGKTGVASGGRIPPHAKSWEAGYKVGHTGKSSEVPA
jgi:hypothetical protein